MTLSCHTYHVVTPCGNRIRVRHLGSDIPRRSDLSQDLPSRGRDRLDVGERNVEQGPAGNLRFSGWRDTTPIDKSGQKRTALSLPIFDSDRGNGSTGKPTVGKRHGPELAQLQVGSRFWTEGIHPDLANDSSDPRRAGDVNPGRTLPNFGARQPTLDRLAGWPGSSFLKPMCVHGLEEHLRQGKSGLRADN